MIVLFKHVYINLFKHDVQLDLPPYNYYFYKKCMASEVPCIYVVFYYLHES